MNLFRRGSHKLVSAELVDIEQNIVLAQKRDSIKQLSLENADFQLEELHIRWQKSGDK